MKNNIPYSQNIRLFPRDGDLLAGAVAKGVSGLYRGSLGGYTVFKPTPTNGRSHLLGQVSRES